MTTENGLGGAVPASVPGVVLVVCACGKCVTPATLRDGVNLRDVACGSQGGLSGSFST